MKLLLCALLFATAAHAQGAYTSSRAALYSGFAIDAVTTEMALAR